LVVILDADGQHEPAEIIKLIFPVVSGAADLSVGSRYLADGAKYKVAVGRRFGAWIFGKLVSLCIGDRITDPTSGFQCLNSTALKLYVTLPDFPEKTPDADLLIYVHRYRCRITEVPVDMYADEGGDSMHGFIKSLFYIPKMLTAMLGMIFLKLNPKNL
jgi:hypothetical protein